jgi:alcohol dehydrogenase
MWALQYGGAHVTTWAEVPMAKIHDTTDVIVRVDMTTICGSDLHILKGDVPEVTVGRILGHEAVGTVHSVGSAVTTLKVGDRVIVSAITSCATCIYCRQSRYGQCINGGGWILGHLIDGTQAQYVRVPYASTSTTLVPKGVSDEELLMLADILPTGYEIGVLNGQVKPGDVVAVVGAGPVGLSAIVTAKLLSPRVIIAIDLDDGRLARAKEFGADITINNSTIDPLAQILAMTDDLGVDVAIEAVGVPASFDLATTLVRPCGRVANIGVHGAPVTLHMEKLWGHDVTITMGLVDTSSTPTLLSLVASRFLDVSHFATHHFTMSEFQEAYRVFADAATSGALKVIITP